MWRDQGGVDGAIYAAQVMWESHHMEENCGSLLIDARNAFNEQDRMVMLWNVQYRWPSGARFMFNLYKHWSTLVIRNNYGSREFLPSQQGVTQGDPIAMLGYALCMLPLTLQLKVEFPEVEKPWYAEYAVSDVEFARIRAMLERLLELGPGYGYHPESSKSIVVVVRHNLERGKVYFSDLTGSRYLGGFVGEDEDRDEWLESKIATWVDIIKQLSTVAVPYPQSEYAVIQKSVQAEGTFVQRLVWDVGDKFYTIREAMHRYLF
jgi:hypothetical protein